jgi:hypothetical protein
MRRVFGVVLVAAVVGVLLSFGPVLGFVPGPDPAPDEVLMFIPAEPCAVFDSRTSTVNPGPLPAGSVTAFTVAGVIPAGQIAPEPVCVTPPGGVPAVELNLVAIAPAGIGNLKVAEAGVTPGGGVVNYSATSGSNNSNALSVEVDGSGRVEVTVNAAASHVRVVVLGYWVPGTSLFLDKTIYDPDGDGSVTQADNATQADQAAFVNRDYCRLATEFPASYPSASCQPVSRTLDGTGTNVGEYTSVAIGTDGYPIISYRDSTNTDLKVVHCTAVDCSTTDTPVMLDGTGTNVGFYASLAIGTDGYPIIGYYDHTNSDLKVVHCTATDCSTTDTPLMLDGTGTNVGFYTSLAIGTDGHPIISYYDASNLDLKVVHCTAVDCSTTDTPLMLDGTGSNVGEYTSLAVGTDGYPIITYKDVANADLKVVHCTAADCSTTDTPLMLDGTGSNVGQHTSLAIGTDGYPIISYYDLTNGELKVARIAP